MLKRLTELLERHKLLEDMRQLEERELSDEAINEEQDEIIATVFCLVRDKLPELKHVHSTLEKVQSVIECTYGEESDADEDGDTVELPPSHSAADVVQMLCEIEGIVDEAVAVLGDDAVEFSRPVHVIVVYDQATGYEAIYKDGDLFDSDMNMYASDLARAIGEDTANVSSVAVTCPPEDDWPKRFDDLMPYITTED